MTSLPPLSGLGPGAMVMTDDGELPVEWLARGDRVLTRDNGPQPVLFIARLRGETPEGLPLPDPVLLCPDDEGAGLSPREKLYLAPGHRVLLQSPQVELHFGVDEALACVADLSRRYRVRRDPKMAALSYTQIILPRHEIISVGGLWVESTDSAMAARLTTPRYLRRNCDLFRRGSKTARFCLTGQEAALIRHLTPRDIGLRDLLISQMVA